MGLISAAALLVLSVGAAVAQPRSPAPTAPTAQQKAEIERLAKQAIAKGQKGDHEGAIKDYLDAYAIAPATTTVLLSNIGHEFKLIKKPYEALKYYCLYLEKEPTGAAANYVLAEASGIWRELGNKEGEVCVKKPEPPVEKKPDPPVDTGLTGTQPIKPPPPAKSGGGMKIAGLGIAGAGVVVLGAGFIFGTKAQAKSDLITQGPPLDAQGNQLDWGEHLAEGWDGIEKIQSDGETYEKLQIGLSVVGGAMVIGGTALYFLGRSKATDTTVSASATKSSGGVVFSGRF